MKTDTQTIENIISKIREGTTKKKKSDQEQEKEPRSKSNEREREGRARDFRRRPENTPQSRSRSRGGNQEQDRDRDYRLIYRRETDYHDYENRKYECNKEKDKGMNMKTDTQTI